MKSRFAPRHAAVLLVLLGVSGALYLALQPRHRAAQMRDCQSNLKAIGLAMSQYMRDYDEKYPVAARWMDDLKPYANYSAKLRKLSYDQQMSCPTSGAFYAYNRFYSGLNQALDDTVEETPLAFDVATGARNFSDDGGLWPLPPVHQIGFERGNNVLFADGHVKWMREKPLFRALSSNPKPRWKIAPWSKK